MDQSAINSIIGNPMLASAIVNSVSTALNCPFLNLVGGESVWDIFKGASKNSNFQCF
jgi:hypothetical protein